MDNKELDYLISEKVMNITAWLEKRGEYEHIVFQREGEREPYRGTKDWEEASKRYRIIPFSEIDHHNHVVGKLPSYSTDISSAFEVVEKLRESGYLVNLAARSDIYLCFFHRWNDRHAPHLKEAKTAPLAICLAALSLEERT